jgi:tyrosinase
MKSSSSAGLLQSPFAGRKSLFPPQRTNIRYSTLLWAAAVVATLLLVSASAMAQAGNCMVNGDGSCKMPGSGCTGDTGVGKCTNVPNGSGGQSCKCVGRCVPDKDTACPDPAPPKGMVRLDIDDKNFDLQAFRDGVASMMKACVKTPDNPLGEDNPLCWKYQAYIHGREGEVAKKIAAQDCCQHSGFYFLSWHRMEIYYFERIVRAMSGNPKLTVPYWNFTDTIKADKRKIPLSFRTAKYTNKQGKEVDNPLYYSHRRPGINDPGSKPLCAEIVKWEDAFNKTKFFVPVGQAGSGSFGGAEVTKLIHPPLVGTGTGSLENVPHNTIHGTVGIEDDPLSLWDPAGAGLDPLFWPFHVNLDRAWYWWQKAHPDTLPPADSAWAKQKFIFFDVEMVRDKPQAKQVCLTGQQIINIAEQLGYKYDSGVPFTNTEGKTGGDEEPLVLPLATNASPLPASVVTATLDAEVPLGAETITISLQLTADVQRQIHRIIANEVAQASIVLSVEDIQADRMPGSNYEVYLNLPSKAVLEDEGRYYAGNLNFFGLGHHHEDRGDPMESGRSFDITEAVRQLAANNEWTGGSVNVTFAVPRSDPDEDCIKAPLTSPDHNLRFGRLTLSVITSAGS